MSAEEQKELKIKVGSVKRTKSEFEAYVKEEVAQRSKIDKMKADGAEEADVKKQMEVLNDTLTVLPDTRQRLAKYAQELSRFMDNYFPEPPDASQEALRTLVLESRQLVQDVGSMLGLVLEPAGAEGGEANDGPETDF
mmetsp:Transcript_68345/g.222257  ORF Transcript_68345/g.222257 Transcript_68345/m.222257 type:complete len:138 (+) Transcript_68345:89-502(+)